VKWKELKHIMDKRTEKAAIEIKKAKIDSKQLDIPL
jgi:hypothetical protein